MFPVWSHIQLNPVPEDTHPGAYMDASHLKCKKCDYSAGDSYSLKLHSRTHDPEGKKFKCDRAGYDRAYNTKGHLN